MKSDFTDSTEFMLYWTSFLTFIRILFRRFIHYLFISCFYCSLKMWYLAFQKNLLWYLFSLYRQALLLFFFCATLATGCRLRERCSATQPELCDSTAEVLPGLDAGCRSASACMYFTYDWWVDLEPIMLFTTTLDNRCWKCILNSSRNLYYIMRIYFKSMNIL